jgi:hypothetical protein
MPTPLRTAIEDPALTAVVLDPRPLRYADGADEALDRPAHVRAGSGLARVPGGVALVQDDANFIAIVDPATGLARDVPLPAGPGGVRQFDDTRGNKREKLDLEACVADTIDGVPTLVALGSGATSLRERIVLVRDIGAPGAGPTVIHARSLYARLRAERDFAGDELNVEGAIRIGDTLRLFARGNGEHSLCAATCDLDWSRFLAYLRDPDAAPPEPAAIVRHDLGMLDDVRLGFTDAAWWEGTILFTAAAEDSDNAVDDGDVAGSVLGTIAPDGTTRWTRLVTPDGAPYAGKVEGILAPTDDAGDEVTAVVDADDAGAPSLLCRIRLEGPWR